MGQCGVLSSREYGGLGVVYVRKTLEYSEVRNVRSYKTVMYWNAEQVERLECNFWGLGGEIPLYFMWFNQY